MKKFAILSSFALLGAVSLASLHIKPAIAQCGWESITCSLPRWPPPPGECNEPPKPRPNLGMQSQDVDIVIIQTPVNSRVLDFISSPNNEEPLLLGNKNSGETQQWELRKQDGFYVISSMVNYRVLDFRNAQNNKEPVILANYHGGDSQKWLLEKLPNGRYLIKSKANGRVLDFANSENNKESVLLTNENLGYSQQWVLEPTR